MSLNLYSINHGNTNKSQWNKNLLSVTTLSIALLLLNTCVCFDSPLVDVNKQA